MLSLKLKAKLGFTLTAAEAASLSEYYYNLKTKRRQADDWKRIIVAIKIQTRAGWNQVDDYNMCEQHIVDLKALGYAIEGPIKFPLFDKYIVSW